MSDEQRGDMDGELESNAARCRRSASAPAQTLAPFGSACAAGDAVATMGFVHFYLGLPWVVHALGYAPRNSNGASVQGRAWKEIADAFMAQALAEDAAVAAGEDDKGEDAVDAMGALLDLPDPAAADPVAAAKKKQKVLGRIVVCSAREKCPLEFPDMTDEREVCLISFKKNESECDLAGAPLVQSPGEDNAAVAAAANGAGSQYSLPSRESAGSQTRTKAASPPVPVDRAVSAQGAVHAGYTCRWLFPTKEYKGAWEGTVARAGDLHGKVDVCQLATFTRA
ncbi:unnamed protein product [Prorocentrum cordatum]|uniref:Uncharacterized protein n=1 Tax=Prorocentrum cordatum TaxID=2364126 RepID=A0ABN9QH51_9DINO|nr:unnamed protein product [Polarella glacialis]